jgi:hydrogenase 3 maturation protease
MDTHSFNHLSVLQDLGVKLKGRTAVLGVGNILRSDDGFGTLLAERLMSKIDLKVFAGGSAPENYLGVIMRQNPQTILVVDAVDFGGSVGEAKIFELKELNSKSFFCTHNHTLDFLCNFLKSNIQVDLYLLAVQPKNLKLGDVVSLQVQERLEQLELWFKERYPLCPGKGPDAA